MTTRSRLQVRGILVLAIAGFGLLLRLHRLDALSFWLDEGISAWMVEVSPVSRWMGDVHPPLYYALLAAWHLWSGSDWWLRFLSVLLGTATIPVVYGLGQRLFGGSAGEWSAALLSALYIHVTYSQEARMYALLVLLFACAFWGLVEATRQARALGWIVYATSASLLTYAHGLGCLYVLILAMLFPVLAVQMRSWRAWRAWLIANAIVALVFGAYGLVYARRIHDVAGGFWVPSADPEPPIFTTLFRWTVLPIPPFSAMLARHLDLDVGPFLGQWVWFLPILAVSAVAIAGARAEGRRAVTSLVLAYTAPIVLLTAISLTVRPLLIPRVLLPTVIPMVLLFGSLGGQAGPLRPRWSQATLAIVMGLLLLGTFYSFRYDAKEQWREASWYLQARLRPSDVVLVNLDFGRFLIERYDREGTIRQVPRLVAEELEHRCRREQTPCLERAIRAYPRGQTVWLVEGHLIKERPRTSTEIWLLSHLEVQEQVLMVGVSVARARLVY